MWHLIRMIQTNIFTARIAAWLLCALLPLLPQNSPGQENLGQKMFHTRQSQRLLPDFSDSYGVVFRDINLDGLPDLYVVRFRNLNRLFLNRGVWQPFEDYTIESGLGGNLMPRGQQNLELGASSVDFDNDGLPDMIIAGWGVSTRIFRQEKNHHFSEWNKIGRSPPAIDGNGAFWADVNRDGYPDVFVTDEHHPNHLFLGSGLGNFTDKSRQWGIADSSVSQGAAFADVDDDGFPDLYVCNWFKPDVFYRNTGSGFFQPQELDLFHLTHSLNSNGVTFGDIDNDGDLDLLVTDRDRFNRLYRNDTPAGSAEWKFADITESAGIQISFPAYGSVMADFNNDGWLDIWVSCIGPNMLFLNRGLGKFEKVFEEQHPYWHPKKFYSTGAAAADVDLDGDLDLFVANKDTNSVLYLNPSNNKNFLKIKLTGVRSNRDAIGAKIWLYPAGKLDRKEALLGYREITAGGGYLSQNSLVQHFGVSIPVPYDVRVRYPSGREQVIRNLQRGNSYAFREYGGLFRTAYRSYHFVQRTLSQPQFWIGAFLFILLVLSVIGYTVYSISRYHWAARQIAGFLALTVILLYGIFLILQPLPLTMRFLVQLGVLGSFLLFLTVFMEKLRRMEIRRLEYRRLLRNFSAELIVIKDNQKLYSDLVQIIHKTVKPVLCAVYRNKKSHLMKVAATGHSPAPGRISLPPGLLPEKLPEKPALLCKQFKLPPNAHLLIFPIVRADKIYGFLMIAPPSPKKPFSAEDREVFRMLAAQTSIAVENNLYIEESKRLIQKITEAETREKYVKELEEKNRTLKRLYRELQDAQTQLIQTEKMASLGQLVAGVAHELNNPISYIYANMKQLQNYIAAITQLIKVAKESALAKDYQAKLQKTVKDLQEKFDLDFIQKDIETLISESIEGSRRVKDVVLTLRNFSRLDEAELKRVDLHEGLDATLLLLNNEIKNRIQVHKNYGELPPVMCHPGQINQVFMNLLVNAIQAIEGKGNIWIQTRKEKDRVVIEIRDDGRGIPKAVQDKIFDPFFTTKPVGEGTGLGLSICYRIIQNHRGSIEVESEEGKGSVFRIILPV